MSRMKIGASCEECGKHFTETSVKVLYAKLVKHYKAKHKSEVGKVNYLDAITRGSSKKEAKVAKRKFGVEVSFKGDTTTLEQLFGTKPIMSTQMAKFLWAHIRAAKFLAQKDWQPKVGEKVKYQWSKDKKFYLGEITKVTGKLYTVKDAGNPAQVQKVKRNEILKV